MKINKFFTIVCAAAAVSFCVSAGMCNSAFAQGRKDKKGEKPEMQNGQRPGDQGDKPGADKDKAQKGPMTMDKFITSDTKVMKGFTTVYQQKDDKWCINVNDSISIK